MQTASEIPGLVPEKIGGKYPQPVNKFSNRQKGFNQAIDQIAQKRLEVVIDREKLAGECYRLRLKISKAKGFVEWDVICRDKAHPIYWVCLEDADAIILAAKQNKELCRIEVVNESK